MNSEVTHFCKFCLHAAKQHGVVDLAQAICFAAPQPLPLPICNIKAPDGVLFVVFLIANNELSNPLID
ncbi:hypothetical protein O9929_16535 [Vibrio lentus]|nr:hypothetical protein [Vibrio lentus]